MKKTFKKSFATFLAGLMCMSAMGLTSFAAEKTDLGTTWYGDELKVGVTAGNNGYTFRSVYQEKKPAAYEMSNHMVTNGGINQIPQLLVMVDASKDYTWTPDGLYTLGESNFEALYCCDAETGYNDGIYYKRMNLEDSDYYSDEAAKHIRAIVTNSYPYVSLSEMKDSLKKAGFEGAEELTRAEIITAVQSAIWAYANKDIAPYEYVHTFDVPTNTQWGRVIHDFTGEMKVWWTTGYRQFSKDETVRARINTLIDYLKGLEPVSAKADQIIISNLEIADTATGSEADDLYNVALKVTLNNAGSNENDDLIIKVYADGELAGEEKVVSGHTCPAMTT